MKNILFYLLLGCIATVGLSACGGEAGNSIANANKAVVNTAEKAINTAGNAANSVANAVSSATTASPESFMKDAAQGGMAEVQLGKLAEQKSKDPEIKKFAQMMVTDHTAAGNDLKALATKKNFTLPTDIGSHKSTYDKLNGLSGTDFDKAYVDDMVSDHEEDVEAFQKQADHSTDPEVKAFAAKVLPVVKKHLDAIKAIKAKMK